MKSHNISALAILIALFVSTPSAWSQSTTFDTVYAVSAVDAAYLRYYTIVNIFDSAVSRYEVGEMRIRTNGVYSRVRLDTLLKTDSIVVNAGVTGVQSSLANVLQSRVFYIDPMSDSITLFRHFNVVVLNESVNHIPSQWTVDDTTEVVLQLVRTDGVVLLTLDSVGIPNIPILGTTHASYYGTSPSITCRAFYIPNPVRSCSAFIRVVPKRFGTTSYGMQATCNREKWSLSASLTCSNASSSVSFSSIARNKFFEKYIDYFDTYYTGTCEIPAFIPSLTQVQTDSVIRRYYDTVCTEDDKFFRIKGCDSYKAGHRGIEPKGANVTIAYGNGTLTANGTISHNASCQFEIYDLQGNAVESIPTTVVAGEFTQRISLRSAPGTYIVAFRNLTDSTWTYQKIAVP